MDLGVKRLDRPLGAELVHKAEPDAQADDRQDDSGIRRLANRSRDNRRRDEQNQQEAAELPCQHAPEADTVAAQDIGAELGQRRRASSRESPISLLPRRASTASGSRTAAATRSSCGCGLATAAVCSIESTREILTPPQASSVGRAAVANRRAHRRSNPGWSSLSLMARSKVPEATRSRAARPRPHAPRPILDAAMGQESAITGGGGARARARRRARTVERSVSSAEARSGPWRQPVPVHHGP